MKIALFPNLEKKNALRCTKEVCNVLESCNVVIYLDEKYKEKFNDVRNVEYGKFEDFFKSCDVIITIGGDGTIINCAQIISETSIPILGVNSGRLGFMASIEENQLDIIKQVADKGFNTVNRMMIKCKIKYCNGNEKEISALNDIVISKENLCRLVDFNVYVNDEIVSKIRADGLVFSTPTGSTAYSLSAGGPIIEPTVECIEFTQICPFSLMARTMIFGADKVLKIKSGKPGVRTVISYDGCNEIPVSYEDEVYIYKSEHYIKFVELEGRSFYNSVKNKLMQPIKINEEVESNEEEPSRKNT